MAKNGNKPTFKIHRRREGYAWVLFGATGRMLAHSAKPFTERKTAVQACRNIKKTIADAEIEKSPMGDRPGWSNTL